MHEILAATKQQLTTRAAELESLIASCEQDCEAIADDGNRRIAEIRAEAEAKIDAIRAELAKHAEELTGVRHSAATLDALAEKLVAPFRSEAEKVAAERQKLAEDQNRLAEQQVTAQQATIATPASAEKLTGQFNS